MESQPWEYFIQDSFRYKREINKLTSTKEIYCLRESVELISLSRENLFLVGLTEVLVGTSVEGWNAHLCSSGHMFGGQDREVSG